MTCKRIVLAAALVGAGLGVSGCADQYGYGGVSAGYGYAGGYGDGYGYADGYGYGDGYGYADPYGYGYGPSYFGWYGDFYYPGTGVYVYDRYRRPYRWNDSQRRYWEARRGSYRGRNGIQGNWNGFDRRDGQGYGNRPNRGAEGGQGYGNRYPNRGAFGGRQDDYPNQRGYPNQGTAGRPGGGYGYPGRGAGEQFRSNPNPDGNAGATSDNRGNGDSGRTYGGRWRNPSASSTQGVTQTAPRVGGRSNGGWRSGGGRHRAD